MVIKQSLVRYSIAGFFILAMLLGGGTIYLVVQGVLPVSQISKDCSPAAPAREAGRAGSGKVK
jgi:hypothetical protein